MKAKKATASRFDTILPPLDIVTSLVTACLAALLWGQTKVQDGLRAAVRERGSERERGRGREEERESGRVRERGREGEGEGGIRRGGGSPEGLQHILGVDLVL